MQVQNNSNITTNSGLFKVLSEMCRRVDTDFSSIDLSENDWYTKHTWSINEQDSFRDWLVNQLLSNKNLRDDLAAFPRLITNKKNATKLANQFILTYGWKLKEQ